jgi:malonyl-CoA/methylmalonyl-CoA synthetase
MNPAYTDAEVGHVLADAEPSIVVCDPARAATVEARLLLTLDEHGGGALTDVADDATPEFDDVAVAPDDLAALLYTSGTTGRPKGALLSQRNLTSNAVSLHRIWGFRPDDVLLHALPIFHVHGLFVAINCAIANGTGMVFLPRFDVEEVLEALPRCSVFMGVPTYYTRLLSHPGLAEACSRMRLLVSGSAPLLASTHDQLRIRTGLAILERYGMTETVMIASNPLDSERRPGTVGFPLPDTEIRITDGETGEPVAGDHIGDIEVRGPNVCAGYWRRPELNGSAFTSDGFFRTGDLGAFDADGYLRIVGRSTDLVISGGLNVYPKEVEEVLDSIDGVLESAVVGIPDPDFGEAVAAAVVLDAGSTIGTDAIRAAARRRLAGFKMPKRIDLLDELPRNSLGKVEKKLLRERMARP